MDDQEIIQEFLLESAENLGRLDEEMVQLERDPGNRDLLASVFRTIHTIKGTCGFLGYNRLEALTHVTEDILAELRDGRRALDSPLTTLLLESLDGTRRILKSIEAGHGEGPVFETELLSRLEASRDHRGGVSLGGRAQSPAVPEQPDGLELELSPASPSTGSSVAATADSTLRVDVGLLDRLMNLVGELVLTRNQLLQYTAGREDSSLVAVSQRLNLITSELQEGVMKTRMQPIGVVWNKLPRVVRDLAASLNKQIVLEMEGADTELDRTIIEAIKDPLTHIVRNSCDHGIESPRERQNREKPPQGRLTLRAWHEGGQVNIEIADDGAGIDPDRVKAKALERRLITEEQAARMPARDAVNLVFLPGFSTAASVTNISGRGVGMDVVRTHIERIGGEVELASEPGRGVTVRVRIPLTLAIIPGLVVKAGGERFIIPQLNLHELIQTGDGGPTIEYVHSAPVLRRRNALLPLTDLSAMLELAPQRRPGEASIVVVQSDQQRFGLIVDAICDTEEIVVKPLSPQLKLLNCYAGATIMGDGRIALILDISGLAHRSGITASANQSQQTAGMTAAFETSSELGRALLLLFRAGGSERLAAPLARVARLEKIDPSALERASGRPVAKYRNRILPLVDMASEFQDSPRGGDEALNVVVFRSGSHEIGLIVDEITDIVEEAVLEPCASDRSGLLGSALIGGKVTDIVDLDSLAATAMWVRSDSLSRLNEALTVGFEIEAQEVLS